MSIIIFIIISDERYCYIDDLMAMDQCRSGSHVLPVEAMKIVTPLKLEAWKQMLMNHPDRSYVNYIVDGIKHGFRIGFDDTNNTKLLPATRNMQSASDHYLVITEYLHDECLKGRIAGPFSGEDVQSVHISRFGVIPKKSQPGKWRLIVDLSHPNEASVNDGINSSLCSLSYASVDDAADIILQLGTNTLLAKLDIKSAYRIVPVHPEDRWLLGMMWMHKVYIDMVLPFGLRSAPKVFNAIADALEWIMHMKGIQNSIHYLDDFLFVGKPQSCECETALQIALSVCSELGVPIANDKVQGPHTELDFLGIVLDSEKMEVRLPTDKLARLKLMICSWSRKKVCTKREILSLIGHLSHACKVIKPGRPFLRRLIELSTKAKKMHHHLRLNRATRSDLGWWKFFLDHWNGRGLMAALSKCPHDITVTSDASGSWGCGAFCKKLWFSMEWGDCWKDVHITIKELLPIIIASAIWGPEWIGRHILFQCDNAAVVAIVNSGRSKHPLAMHYTRLLYLLAAAYNFSFRCSHIPGKSNVAADALSRNNTPLFLQTNPTAESHPSHIPPKVSAALCRIAPDWMCENWRRMLSSILTKV